LGLSFAAVEDEERERAAQLSLKMYSLDSQGKVCYEGRHSPQRFKANEPGTSNTSADYQNCFKPGVK